LAQANQEAKRFGHAYIGTEHLLLGLIREEGSAGVAILRTLAVDLNGVRLEVERILTGDPAAGVPGGAGKTPRAKRVIEYAIEEARTVSLPDIGSGQLLLGMLRESEGLAGQVLSSRGVNLDQVRQVLSNLRDLG
jgi:ATP-dependent Clp protease ATP-binding subunit ClpC